MSQKSKLPVSLVHILSGSRDLEKERYVKQLLGKIPGVSDDFGISKFDLKTKPLQEILSLAKNFPFISDFQIFWVKLNKKLLKDDKELLGQYLEAPSNFTILILDIQEGSLDTKGFQKNSHCTLFDSEVDKEGLRDIVSRRLEQEGKRMTPKAFQLFIQKCSGDNQWASAYLDYLLLYMGGKAEITEVEIQKIVPDSLSYGSFDLVNALISKKFDRVLEVFRDSIENGVTVQDIMGLIHWQLRRVYEAKCMLVAGNSPQEIGKTLRVGNYFLKDFINNVNRFNIRQIEKAIESLTQLDTFIKTGKVEPKIGLEKYFVEMTC